MNGDRDGDRERDGDGDGNGARARARDKCRDGDGDENGDKSLGTRERLLGEIAQYEPKHELRHRNLSRMV